MSTGEAKLSKPLSVMVEIFGEPASFALVGHDPGMPGPGQVRIEVHAAGVSLVDILISEGKYQLRPDLPFVPGSECAGIIEAVGDGVDPGRIGERVCATSFIGAFGQTVIMAARSALPIPPSMTFADAAVFRVSHATAYHALVQRGSLQAGETLLVLGASGAIGHAAVQIGKALGTTVIASASTEAKRTFVTLAGADATVDAHSPTWRDDVKAASGGRGIDVVVDPIGGDATERAFRSLNWNGRLLVIGFASGAIARLPVNLALLKGASLIGVDIRQSGEKEPEVQDANMRALFDLHAAGKLKLPVGQIFPLSDYAAALRSVRDGTLLGRAVLAMR